MTIVSTRARARKPGIRVRGYYIVGLTITHQAINSGLLWLPSAPTAMYEAICSDESTLSARLVRSGRTLARYQRAEVQA